MVRIRLTPGYWRSARRLAPAESTTARKLAACVGSLGNEPVPGSADTKDFLPPVLKCWARRVPGAALAVLFDRHGDEIRVLAVRRWP